MGGKKGKEEDAVTGGEQMSELLLVVKVMASPDHNSRSPLPGSVQGDWLSAMMCLCVCIHVLVHALLKSPEQVLKRGSE